MLVLIRIAVLAVREIVVFFIKTGWYWGKAVLVALIILVILIFDALRLAPALMNHSIANTCDTSFM